MEKINIFKKISAKKLLLIYIGMDVVTLVIFSVGFIIMAILGCNWNRSNTDIMLDIVYTVLYTIICLLWFNKGGICLVHNEIGQSCKINSSLLQQ